MLTFDKSTLCSEVKPIMVEGELFWKILFAKWPDKPMLVKEVKLSNYRKRSARLYLQDGTIRDNYEGREFSFADVSTTDMEKSL